MLAAYAGHASTVSLLISLGADVNRLNDRNQSPLSGAVFKNHEAVVRTLFSAGADPRIGAPNAIDSAFMFGQRQYFDLFGVSEADVSPGAPAPPSTVREHLDRQGGPPSGGHE